MKFRNHMLAIALKTALPLIAQSANAQEKIVKETTTMSNGSKVVVTSTTDKDAAADSMAVKTTTYSFDANKDGFIDNNEAITYVTRYADKNNDGYIDINEYESGCMTYFANMMETDNQNDKPKSYTYWDKDKDNRLDTSELETLVANKGLYKKWDLNKDGKIDSLEFSQATFLAYDDDKNGSISIDEWKDVVM